MQNYPCYPSNNFDLNVCTYIVYTFLDQNLFLKGMSWKKPILDQF